MTLAKKHGYALLAVAAWNLLTFGMFAKNLYAAYAGGEDRATGYWVAHTVLIVVNYLIAVVLVRIGLRILKGSDREGAP